MLCKLRILRTEDRSHGAADVGERNPSTATYQVRIQYVHAVTGIIYTSGSFLYGQADPYAVQFLFNDGDSNLVRLAFSRELLMQGLDEEVGEGSLTIRCRVRHGVETMMLTSLSDYGEELIMMNKQAVTVFLAKTFQLVPAGEEGRFLDVDSTIDQLLSNRPSQ